MLLPPGVTTAEWQQGTSKSAADSTVELQCPLLCIYSELPALAPGQEFRRSGGARQPGPAPSRGCRPLQQHDESERPALVMTAPSLEVSGLSLAREPKQDSLFARILTGSRRPLGRCNAAWGLVLRGGVALPGGDLRPVWRSELRRRPRRASRGLQTGMPAVRILYSFANGASYVPVCCPVEPAASTPVWCPTGW